MTFLFHHHVVTTGNDHAIMPKDVILASRDQAVTLRDDRLVRS